MSTIHSWFRSGAYSLLGHIDLPPAECGQLGVLIVPSFGWEDVCSYRPLRFMGRTFAANGIPAMRFDLPGTGDSSGGARDCGLFDAWVQSIPDAAGELRKTTGVADVAVVGIRLGAMLAVMAAARGANFQDANLQDANFQDLVLWGARATGRALLRELRTFFSMERGEYANGAVSPPESVPGLEMGGFLISPEMQRSLEALDLSSLPGMQGRRILVLSCDDLPPDAKLVRALETSGCQTQVKAGSGYAAMMALPHETVAPAATSQVILEFFKERREERQEQTSARTAKCHAATTAIEDAVTGVVETIYTVEAGSASMFGILSEPAPEAPRVDCCLLFLNAGAVRHIGPNRMWVEAARRWAAKGVVSLRLDLQGIGESDGEQNLDTAGLYQDQLVEQVELAMDSLRCRAGSRSFAAIGLCSGAFWAFHAAIRNPQVRGAILLNQRLFFWDPEVDRRRLLRRTAKGLIHWADWRRLARGEVPGETIKEIGRGLLDRLRARTAGRRLQIPPGAMADAWSAIERNHSRLTLVFADDEPLLRELEEEGQLPPETLSGAGSGIRCIRIGNSGHTFRPLWAQAAVHELIDRELDRILCESEEVIPVAAKSTVISPRQDEVNRAVYHSPGVYRSYLSKILKPPEIACLSKYRSHISGRDVLDIGVGAGRTTRHLAPLARRYEAVDYSPVMVGYMKEAMPDISVRQADFRNLGIFDDRSFDFVLATDNVIDALAHEDRLRALREACRVLRPGGVLAFSSHNIRYKKAFSGPRLDWSSNPVRFASNCVGYLLCWWNHLRVGPLRRTTPEYALLNDPGHRYACLHYYLARSEVNSQLAGAGMRLIEVLDAGGQAVPEGAADSENPSLAYVAERQAS